jgi:hypothetical protein
MSNKLGDFLTAINYSKADLLDTDDPEKLREYNPFVINRCLSYFPDTIMIANEMNSRAALDKDMQFHYLMNRVRKGKRFAKWAKPVKPDDLKAIKEFYNYNDRRALEVLEILTEDQVKEIKKRLDKGGR